MDALSEMLGMGITIQLRNMFSGPARAIVTSSRGLSEAVASDAAKVNNGWKLMAAGGAMMFVGTGLLSFLGAISKVSLKSSSDLEIFRQQIRLLAKDSTAGDTLFSQLTKFSTTTPFTIPQVMAGARNLLAFGFSTQRVLDQLKLAGDWASIMSVPIDEAALIIGKVRSGAISYAMRSLQRLGVGYADIAAAGGPIDLKTMRTQRGADPEKFLTAINKVLNEKFAGGMGIIMNTIPGMLTNMKDQLILMAASIGDVIKPQIKDILRAVLTVFNPDIVLPFARAVGGGLAFVIRLATLVIKPIAEVALWFMRLVGHQPLLAKLAFTLIAITGAVLVLAGASLILLGIWNAASFILSTSATGALLGSFAAAIPIVLGLAAAGLVLYTAWRNNVGGIQTLLVGWWNTAKLVFGGLGELFSSLTNGVGSMSVTTANALQNAGLFGVVTQLFMVGYRFVSFVGGIIDGIKALIDWVAYFVGSPIALVLQAFDWLGSKISGCAEMLGLMNVVALTSSGVWHSVGVAVGGLIGMYAGLRLIQMAYTVGVFAGQAVIWLYTGAMTAYRVALALWGVAARGATVAQWALNVAMDANPIGLVIIGVAALIGVTIALIQYHKQVADWFSNLPGWARLLISVFAPLFGIAMTLIRNWDNVKNTIVNVATIFKNVWTMVIDWVIAKFDLLLSKFHLFGDTAKSLWNFGLSPTSSFHIETPKQTSLESSANQQLQNLTARSNHLTTVMDAQDRHNDRMFQHFEQVTAQFAAKTQQPVVLKVDGKTLATTVNKHNKANTTAGRD